jgi:hypothetical protein
MNYPAASNGVSIGIFKTPQGAGNLTLVRRRRIKLCTERGHPGIIILGAPFLYQKGKLYGAH